MATTSPFIIVARSLKNENSDIFNASKYSYSYCIRINLARSFLESKYYTGLDLYLKTFSLNKQI